MGNPGTPVYDRNGEDVAHTQNATVARNSVVRVVSVQALDVWKLMRHEHVVITEAALTKLVASLRAFPERRGLNRSQVCATPDGRR